MKSAGMETMKLRSGLGFDFGLQRMCISTNYVTPPNFSCTTGKVS